MPRFLHSQKSAELLSSIPFFGGERSKVSKRSSSVRAPQNRIKGPATEIEDVAEEEKTADKAADTRVNHKSKPFAWDKWTPNPKRRTSKKGATRSRRLGAHGKAPNMSPYLSDLPFESSDSAQSPQSPQSFQSPDETCSESEPLGSPLIPLKTANQAALESPMSSSLDLSKPLDNPAASQTSFDIANEIYESTLIPEHKSGSDRKKFVEPPQRRGSLLKTGLNKKQPHFGRHRRAPVKDLFDLELSSDTDTPCDKRQAHSPGYSSTFSSPQNGPASGSYYTDSRSASPMFLSPKARYNDYGDIDTPFYVPRECKGPRYKDSETTIRRRPVGAPPSRTDSPSTLRVNTPVLSAPTTESSSSEDHEAIEDGSRIPLPYPLTHEHILKREWAKMRRTLWIEVEDAIPNATRQRVVIPAGKVWRNQQNNYFPRGAKGMSQNRVVEIIKGNRRKLEARKHPETI